MNPKFGFNGFLFAAAGALALAACGLFSPLSEPPLQPSQIQPTEEIQATPLPDATQTAVAPTATPEPTATPLPVVNIPNPDGFHWNLIANNFAKPIGIANAGDGSGRLFVLEKAGRIVVLQNDQRQPEPFLDIRDRINSEASERGLLGLAFHPNFSENGFFYVHYSGRDGSTVIARFQAAGDLGQADPATEKILLTQPQPYENHNGGMIAFGPDGYLYIGLGDGGLYGDPHGNAQNLNSLLGKLLRIDVDSGDLYAIPADNPFANGGGRPEIWAYGLRNPWRFSFDRLTGDLFIGDVGQRSWEEINFLPGGIVGGANFGWDYFEGFHTYEGTAPTNFDHYLPVTEYGHEGGNCSVTGGYVYRGAALPEWYGIYLYGDYCSGQVRALLHQADGSWQTGQVFSVGTTIASFGEGEDGELYLADIGGGVYRLERK